MEGVSHQGGAAGDCLIAIGLVSESQAIICCLTQIVPIFVLRLASSVPNKLNGYIVRFVWVAYELPLNRANMRKQLCSALSFDLPAPRAGRPERCGFRVGLPLQA